MDRGTAKWISKILTYTAGTSGLPVFGNARSAFPTCNKESGEGKAKKENCWTRVATDRGLCFASYTGDKIFPPTEKSRKTLIFILCRFFK